MTAPASASQVAAEREYYARTAQHYEAMHVGGVDEHAVALASFAGLARLRGAGSVLDVGAGWYRSEAGHLMLGSYCDKRVG